jgi:peptidoglycan/xylan/chitin deacetylase (PgdA/CDA1 family)
MFIQTRGAVIDALLRLFQEYQVPATWAVVGHLFLDRCEAKDGVKHPDMPRPLHSWFKEDWYTCDPASTLEQDPVWYGRDVVEKIMAVQPQQDIGCHSFSHVIFADEGCSAEVAKAEIAQCVALAQEMGIQLKSFVFPRSQEGHHRILRDYGFSCYRALRPGWFNAFNGQAQRVARFVNDILSIAPRCAVVEEKLPGLWNISASAYYRPAYGFGGIIPLASRVRQSIKGITKAISDKGVYHLCLHPWNLGIKTEPMINGLKKILQYADQGRQGGQLDILSMAQLAKQLGSAMQEPPPTGHHRELDDNQVILRR